jgi:hypothetical protein
MGKGDLTWKKNPEDGDYKAASDFLNLLCPEASARKLVGALRKASTVERSAKDLLRAGNLPLLGKDDPHVEDDLDKIHRGKPMAPVLLIRGNIAKGAPLVVADGYHRICAVCHFDEDAPIRCRIAGV